MKKSILILLITLITGVAVPAYAQEAASSSEETVVPAPVATPPTRERQVTLSPQLQTRIVNLAANISNRLDAVVARLTNIANRLESRLSKLEAEGKNTAEARASLTKAQAALQRARNNLSTVDTQTNMVVGATNPKEEWKMLKANFLTTRDLVKVTHTELRVAISSLKNIE